VLRTIGLLAALFLTSCVQTTNQAAEAGKPAAAPSQDAPRLQRELRLTGILEATRSSKVTVPRIVGQQGSLTLTRLIANGTAVKQGDLIAEFDPTQQM